MSLLLASFTVVVFYTESILFLHQISQHNDDGNRTYFFLLISIFTTAQILTNAVSALLVFFRMDFSGKPSGRLLCTVLHLGQQGIAWRLGKLIMFYDKKDWIELVMLRMVSVCVQTLPFLAIHSYLVLTSSVEVAVSVLSLLVALMSASIGLTSFTVRNQVDAISWTNSNDQSVSSKKHCGYLLLFIGTSLGLASRMCSIMLMYAEKFYWIAVPLGVHVSVFLVVCLLYKLRKHKIYSWKDVMKQLAFSYLNVFDLTDDRIGKIQCRYVAYYTMILIENIIMTAVWLVSSNMDYTVKLVLVLSVLTCFVCSVVLKFTAGGLLFAGSAHISSLAVKPSECMNNTFNALDIACPNSNGNNGGAIIVSPASTNHERFVSAIDTSKIKNKSVETSHHQGLQQLKDDGNCPERYINKHKVINVASVYDSPLTVTNHGISKTCASSITKSCIVPIDNDFRHSVTNFDVHSSNSRNTNTLATSCVTSSQLSNEARTQDSGISRSKRFRFHQYPKAVLSLIKKHQLQRKKKKIALFSPSCDTCVGCETVSEKVCKGIMKHHHSDENINELCTIGTDEIPWDEDQMSYTSSSLAFCQSFSRTNSFITELSSTSISTWPSIHYAYFNPNILPKQNPNSSENIKKWLEDVQKHTQEMTGIYPDLTQTKEKTGEQQNVLDSRSFVSHKNRIIYVNKADDEMRPHSSFRHTNRSMQSVTQTVFNQCSSDSSSDDDATDFDDETLSASSHVSHSNSVLPSHGTRSHTSQKSDKKTAIITGAETKHVNVRTAIFSSSDLSNDFSTNSKQRFSHELPRQTFHVVLGDMESLV